MSAGGFAGNLGSGEEEYAPTEHVPGCNVGCEGNVHRLLGDEAEAWWQAIVFGTAEFAEFKTWLAARERTAAEKALRDAADDADASGDPEQGPVHVSSDWLRARADQIRVPS